MRVLADTSVWIDHLRHNTDQLPWLLNKGRIVTHDYIIGELALGSLKDRAEFLVRLQELPRILNASHTEVLELIEQQRLYAQGIGYTDAHLLASVLIDGVAKLWTLDKRLHQIAEQFGVT